MSLDNVKAFLKKAGEDPALRAKMDLVADDGTAAVKLGAEYGFVFTADEFTTVYDEVFGELTDEELTDAAGGLGGIKPKLDFD
jgi:predicted ribosomally synthesized peptide with nif11-like leader